MEKQENKIVLLTEEQLQLLIDAAIEKFFKVINGGKATDKDETEFLTIKDTCERFSITRATLWRWEKIGYLKPKRIGRRVLYNEQQIIECLER